MGFPRYSLWGERRVLRGQWGLHGTSRSHTMSLRTLHSPSTTHHALASTTPASIGAPHPRGFQCYGTEPGAVLVSPTALRLHVHDVLYPGDCKQGAVPSVLMQGVVPGTPPSIGVSRRDAVPRARCPGTACWWGAGRPGRAVASHAQ